jgi:hypothetical protein
MPAARRNLAFELAGRLSPVYPTRPKSLVRDLKVPYRRLEEAALLLVYQGVLVIRDAPGGWLISPDTYPAAVELAEAYDDPDPVERPASWVGA